MALRRFYLEPGQLNGDQVLLTGDLLHHIRDVCRFEIGDQFELLPGDGTALLVTVQSLSNRELRAQVLSSRVIPPPIKPEVVLCLSLPKLPKVDWIVEKCVELGVTEIRPFVSDFSFLRSVSEISHNRVQRWQKLIQGATQQSGRGELMGIRPAVTLKSLLEEFNRNAQVGGLFLYEGEAPLGLAAAVKDIQARRLEQLWLFVGSEGGFSQGEVGLFAQAGLNPVTMGDQILRVETACLAMVSVIKYEIGALG